MPYLARASLCMALLASSLTASATSLNDTIVQAISYHPQVQAEQMSVARAGEQLGLIESKFYPQLSAALGIGREDSNNSATRARVGSSAEMERREASVSLRQLLFDGFDTRWRKAGQERVVEASLSDYQKVLSDTALQAAQLHFAMAKAQQALVFNRQNYKTHEKIAKGVNARVRSGKDDRAKVAQMDARLALSLANLENARADLARAKASYVHFVGVQAEGKFKLEDVDANLPSNVNELLEGVIGANPQYRAAYLRSESTKELYKASQSNLYPSLSIESGVSWNANLDGVRGRNSDAYAMLRLSYDIYQGGQKKAEQRIAARERDRSSYQLEALVTSLKGEAERLWHSLNSSLKQVRYLDRYVKAAGVTKRAYSKQFKIGQRSLIDLLDAENELRAAQILKLDVLEQLAFTRLQLLAISGQLLEALSVPAPSTEP